MRPYLLNGSFSIAALFLLWGIAAQAQTAVNLSVSVKQTQCASTSVQKASKEATFTVFPNPSAEHVTLELTNVTDTQECTVSVVNLRGERVRHFVERITNGKLSKSINTRSFARGAYIVTIETSNGAVFSQSLIIE